MFSFLLLYMYEVTAELENERIKKILAVAMRHGCEIIVQSCPLWETLVQLHMHLSRQPIMW